MPRLALTLTLLSVAAFGSLAGCKTDANCANDCLCLQRGWCGASWGRCEATENVHCEKSELCHLNGLCQAEAGKCVAKSDEQCKASRACTHLGACRAEGGRCK